MQILVFVDVVLSWLSLFWLKLRPKFLADLIDPMYKNIKKIVPTNFWPLDLTPIVVIFALIILQWLILTLFPEVRILINSHLN